MAVQTVTDEQLIAAYRAENGSTSRIATAVGMSARATRSRLAKLKFPPLPPGARVAPSMSPGAYFRPHGRVDMRIEDGIVLVGSDAHYFPNTISTAHRAFVKLCRELKPTLVVLNGDIFDGASISRYPRIGWDDKPTVAAEMRAVTDRLDEIEKACKGARRIWTLGNHDARFETFLAANAAAYEGVQGFRLKDHFAAWQPAWGVWVNDSCAIKHRIRGGIHATRNNTLAAGISTVTGHLHSLKVTPLSDYNGTRWGVDTGAMADPYGEQFADYTELNPVDWRSGFAVLTYWKGQLLWPELVFVRGETEIEFRGKVIEV